MAKIAYRVRNWPQYNQALVNRGSITFWFSEESIQNWHEPREDTGRGRPKKYSDFAITCGLTLKAVFKLPFRAVEGFIKSLIHGLKLTIKAPSYTLLCKRQKTLNISLPKSQSRAKEKIHVAIDTTGIKVFGEGEWKTRQHGYVKKRLWRKLHVAINTQSQEIEAFELTELGTPDGDGLAPLLEKIDKEMGSVIGDGAYDQYKNYRLCKEKKLTLITPPKRDAKLTTECTGYSTLQKLTAETLEALKKRDNYINRIREIGRKEWKKEAGYHRRSLAETMMFRIKTLLGNRFSARTLENQKIEAAIWCGVINQMTQLGMPISQAVS